MPAGRPAGLPKTGGRRKGVPNKATAEVKALAQQHGPAAIEELARIAKTSESDAARVSAIKELLDRAYGKATQPLKAEDGPEGSLRVTFIKRIIVDPVRSGQ